MARRATGESAEIWSGKQRRRGRPAEKGISDVANLREKRTMLPFRGSKRKFQAKLLPLDSNGYFPAFTGEFPVFHRFLFCVPLIAFL
jgi:hypothetical protein